MRRHALRLAVAGAAAGLAATVHAGPKKQTLVDCTCYDIVRVVPHHRARTVFKNTGQNLFDVSRDRRRIVYAGTLGRLYVARIDGKKRRLLDRRRSRWAVFAPDGRYVAYGADGCRLCLARTDGSWRRRFRIAGARGPVAWAPDSRHLAFVVSHASATIDRGVLTVARIDGSARRGLTRGRNFEGGTDVGVKMAWSPHGGRLAYLSGSPTKVHVLRIRTARQLAVLRGRAPVWSPDGRWLAFSNGFRIAVVRYDGRRRHLLDPLSVDPYGSGTSWSPGGRWIAFARYSRRERYQLTLATYDGRRHRVLTTESHEVEIGPTYWGRRGRAILYTRLGQRGGSGI